MGFCCEPRCFSTPHSWQMGWVAVQQLDGASLAPGATYRTWVASQSAAPQSGLRILPTWAPAADAIFLGVRHRAGGDAKLSPLVLNKVHVYQSRAGHTFDAAPSILKASVGALGIRGGGNGWWADGRTPAAGGARSPPRLPLRCRSRVPTPTAASQTPLQASTARGPTARRAWWCG